MKKVDASCSALEKKKGSCERSNGEAERGSGGESDAKTMNGLWFSCRPVVGRSPAPHTPHPPPPTQTLSLREASARGEGGVRAPTAPVFSGQCARCVGRSARRGRRVCGSARRRWPTPHAGAWHAACAMRRQNGPGSYLERVGFRQGDPRKKGARVRESREKQNVILGSDLSLTGSPFNPATLFFLHFGFYVCGKLHAQHPPP